MLLTKRWTIRTKSSLLSKCSSRRMSFPAFSTKMVSYPLIMTSVIWGSMMIFPRIPRPSTDSVIVYLRVLFSLNERFW